MKRHTWYSFLLITLCGLWMTTLSAAELQTARVTSPDGKLSFLFALHEGRPYYSIDYAEQPVILPSLLGLTDNHRDWSREVRLLEIIDSTYDSTWHPLYGEKSIIRDHYNFLQLRLAPGRGAPSLCIQVRAYNEGIAFRYVFPEFRGVQHAATLGYIHITEEATRYTLPEGTFAHFAPYAQSVYQRLPLSDWPGEADRPLTLELPNGVYASLTEAAVVDYVRTKFALAPDQPNTLTSSMYGAVDEIAPFQTPWRVVMIASQPGKLLENNALILNLNPPCAIADPSWIHPGRMMREVTLSTSGAKNVVDFAVKRNLQYLLFDAGWYGHEYEKDADATTVSVDPNRNPKGDLDMAEVVRYAKERWVGIWLYVNQLALSTQLDTILPLYQKWGIKGVKFGFVQVGSQRWTAWMHDAVRKCARYGLLVDIHDEYRPTGFSRTYPNLLSQEGVRGNEEMPDATNNVTLPFTRFIAGPADYTICYYARDFDSYNPQTIAAQPPRKRTIQCTSAHQIAISVVYYSPIQVLYWYDRPSDCGNEPELEFFDRVPTVWDDTRVLNGEIGRYISVARRSGEEWFLGIMNGCDPRKVSVSLDFLTPGRTYVAHIYRDGTLKTPTRTKVELETRRVTSKDQLTADLYGAGGQAVWFEPLSQPSSRKTK